MKIKSKKSLIAILILLTLVIVVVFLKKSNNGFKNSDEAVSYLKQKISRVNALSYWAGNPCVYYLINNENKEFIQIEVHEKHGEECFGNPNTSPLLAQFKINRVTKSIEKYDVVNDKYINWETFTSNLSDGAVRIGCARTERLDNKPPYDRALSSIEERYISWEKNKEDFGIWYFFPPKLVNCIKIIESNVKSKTGAEGYFIFNSSDIKNDYFPINVDSDYTYADDAINSLILVHEITHVEQYLQSINNKNKLSCIDNEVEAFYAQWKFYGIQYAEAKKSIDFRIENDTKLHPQLAILSTLKNHFNLDGVREVCLYGSGKNDVGCIDNYRKNEIKELLLQDDFYKQQCKL